MNFTETVFWTNFSRIKYRSLGIIRNKEPIWTRGTSPRQPNWKKRIRPVLHEPKDLPLNSRYLWVMIKFHSNRKFEQRFNHGYWFEKYNMILNFWASNHQYRLKKFYIFVVNLYWMIKIFCINFKSWFKTDGSGNLAFRL